MHKDTSIKTCGSCAHGDGHADPNCIACTFPPGSVTGGANWKSAIPRTDSYEAFMDSQDTRIDIIGSNGNDGLHYSNQFDAGGLGGGDIYEEDRDPIVESVRAKLLRRSQVGIKKYGTMLDRKDLSELDWLQHAQEEAMDLCNYLERLIQDKQSSSKRSVHPEELTHV